MTPLEQRTLGTLIVSGGIFFWFQQRMLDGGAVVDLTPVALADIYFKVLLFTTLAYSAIAAIVAWRARGVARDERDALVEGKAARNELFVIAASINVALFQAIAHAFLAGYAPFFDLGHLPSLVFVLFLTLWIGEFVRLGSILVYSRA